MKGTDAVSRSIADAVASFIVWAPILTILVFAAWALASGIAHLEAATHGTEYFVPQGETSPLDKQFQDHQAAQEYIESQGF